MLAVAAVLLVGCSSTADDASSATDAAETAGETEPTTSVAPAAEPTVEPTVEPTTPPTSEEPSSPSVAPAEPFEEVERPEPVSDPTSAWIARRFMTAAAIELTWSAPEGAADYQIHRLPLASENPPDVSAMTNENRIYSTSESAEPGDTGERGLVTDTDVTEGEQYWYGVRGLDADGTVLSSGWHQADAVDDEEPPAQVAVNMTVENGVVTLTWEPPAENYELHSYRILRRISGEEFEIVSTTWNLDQTSFVDDDPPDGVDAYAVVAMDFHYNRSEPTALPVDLS